MMFWIIIEKLRRTRPLITAFGKAMPCSKNFYAKHSRKDIQITIFCVRRPVVVVFLFPFFGKERLFNLQK